MNTFGRNFTFTSFGESHGEAVGGVIDGVPARFKIDFESIRHDLERRAGKHTILPHSARADHEIDEIEWLSGIQEGMTLGTPIAFLIRNTNQRPQDYEHLKEVFREGHADWVYEQKYGIRDYRGGGRASARETVARVVAGSIAKQIMQQKGITIEAELVQIGEQTNPALFANYLKEIQQQGDSIGGIIQCTVRGLEVGTGEPIFDKLQARLAYAILSINACKGFDYGSGFEGVPKKGSEINGFSGGIIGGISDGADIVFRCVFKPTPTTPLSLQKLGITAPIRSDVCVAVRAVPIVEAMTALVLVDYQLFR